MSSKKRKQSVSWQITPRNIDRVKKTAKKKGIAAQALVDEALDQYFDKE